jgi:predicted CXXCH cytochrome family protein
MNIRLQNLWKSFGSLSLGAGFLAIAAVILLGGCDLREIVEIENPSWKEAPVAAKGYLGYDNAEVKLTVCGNCHVDQQKQWQTTAHADAMHTLQESGHAAVYCENCHTVGQNGNFASEPVGWEATGDERYHDVQCESCHGGGEIHSTGPSTTQPVASVNLGDLVDLSAAESCAECHQGTHHPFVEQWSKSNHALDSTYPQDRGGSCATCHRGQEAIARFGGSPTYIEANAPEHLGITCVVCHDPHGSQNSAQTRLDVKTIDLELNLCAQCHNRRTIPENSGHGLHPHAPEVALMVGEAGWFPPGANIDVGAIVATHGSTGNANGCASCHVSGFEVTDAATGAFLLNSVGHTFDAIPCVDANGAPTGETGCGISLNERAFSGCAVSGCHSSKNAAQAALSSTSHEIEELAHMLEQTIEIVDPNGEAAGGEVDGGNGTFTVAEGAVFNHSLAVFGDDTYGSSVHNPFLMKALLLGTLQAMKDTYGVVPPGKTEVDWKAELEQLRTTFPVGLTRWEPSYAPEDDNGPIRMRSTPGGR